MTSHLAAPPHENLLVVSAGLDGHATGNSFDVAGDAPVIPFVGPHSAGCRHRPSVAGETCARRGESLHGIRVRFCAEDNGQEGKRMDDWPWAMAHDLLFIFVVSGPVSASWRR